MSEPGQQRIDCLLTTEEAAKVLGLRPRTLRWWRTRNHRAGPDFIKIGDNRRRKGHVRYSLEALQRYIRAGLVPAPVTWQNRRRVES
jgi:Helix-turn-helix domain